MFDMSVNYVFARKYKMEQGKNKENGHICFICCKQLILTRGSLIRLLKMNKIFVWPCSF